MLRTPAKPDSNERSSGPSGSSGCATDVDARASTKAREHRTAMDVASTHAAATDATMTGTLTTSQVDEMLAPTTLTSRAPPLPQTSAVVAMDSPALLPPSKPPSRTPASAANGPCSPRPTTSGDEGEDASTVHVGHSPVRATPSSATI